MVALADHQIVRDVWQRAGNLTDQRDQRTVDHNHPVVGVVNDVGELLGEEPNVERVQHRTHGRDTEVTLQMLLMVPGERADTLISGDPNLPKGIGQPTCVRTNVGKRRSARCKSLRRRIEGLDGADHGITVNGHASTQNHRDQQRVVLHRALHDH